MSVCWFYVQGRCRFGDKCRYLHPREGYPHSDRCNLQQDNYRSSHQSRLPQQPLVRASSFDFNAALEQTRKQEERQKPRGYRDPSYGGSYGSAEDRHVDQRDWYQGNQNRYQSNQDSYQDRYQGNQDRYHGSRDRYQGSQERYQGSQERYQGSQERYQGSQESYQGNRNRYQGDQDQHLGSQSKHRWVKDGHQSERSDNRSNGKAAVTFDFNKALDEATKLDEDRDASESLGDASLGVVRDMKTWKASGQWPFSSYGPYANSLSYPGFADASMEEVRWECYQAKEAGTMSAYIQQLNQIGQNVQQNIDHLLAMTPTAKEILANLPLGQNAKAPFAPASSGRLAASSSGSTATANSILPQVPIMPAARPQAGSERAASIYSLVQDLTEEERQQFLAENFSPGKMPQRPPPREYCALP
ncbi:nucleoporin NUP42 [Ixodes scapularis]